LAYQVLRDRYCRPERRYNLFCRSQIPQNRQSRRWVGIYNTKKASTDAICCQALCARTPFERDEPSACGGCRYWYSARSDGLYRDKLERLKRADDRRRVVLDQLDASFDFFDAKINRS